MSNGEFIVVSGGQTGVDRGALDAALDGGRPCGGWCPEGRRAEDGPLARRYPLRELSGGGYRERTRRNVRDSDATLIIHFGKLAGGTALTLRDCRAQDRPYLLIDAAKVPVGEALRTLCAFIEEHDVRTLNVAGPRASGAPRGHGYAYALVKALLDDGPRRAPA